MASLIPDPDVVGQRPLTFDRPDVAHDSLTCLDLSLVVRSDTRVPEIHHFRRPRRDVFRLRTWDHPDEQTQHFVSRFFAASRLFLLRTGSGSLDQVSHDTWFLLKEEVDQ